MDRINDKLSKEIEKLCSGKMKDIAIDIIIKLQDQFISEDRIKEDIRTNVDIAIREEQQ